MKQEDKELLLKDICARLPYGVKCAILNKELGFGGISGFEGKYPFVIDGITQDGDDIDVWVERGNFSLETVKPYLFPLSSMTVRQGEEFAATLKYLYKEDISIWTLDTYDWCDKNHFDYRGLIPKGIALDATGLNIY